MDEPRSKPREFARKLRQRMTRAEIILWSRLRRRAISAAQFRRQHPIGPYTADFACLPLRLVIEVDGATHCTDQEVAYDKRRDRWLRENGWRVLRFRNEDVYYALDGVLETIACATSSDVPPTWGDRREAPGGG